MKVRPVIAVLMALFAGTLAAGRAATLLDNGDFEQFSRGGKVPRWQYSRHFWHAVEGAGVNNSRALVYAAPANAKASLVSQSVELAGGFMYVLKADVLIEADLNAASEVFLRAKWFDAEKREAGEISVASSDIGEWLNLCVTSKTLSAAVKSAKVEFGVEKQTSARVRFDNVQLFRALPLRLKALECSRKGAEAFDGEVTFTGVLDLSGENIEAWRARFYWRSSDGRVHNAEAAKMSQDAASLTLALKDMAVGSSVVGLVLLKPNGEIAGCKELVFKRLLPPAGGKRNVGVISKGE